MESNRGVSFESKRGAAGEGQAGNRSESGGGDARGGSAAVEDDGEFNVTEDSERALDEKRIADGEVERFPIQEGKVDLTSRWSIAEGFPEGEVGSPTGVSSSSSNVVTSKTGGRNWRL